MLPGHDVDRYPKQAFPSSRVYGTTTSPELRLVTCGVEFNARRAPVTTTELPIRLPDDGRIAMLALLKKLARADVLAIVIEALIKAVHARIRNAVLAENADL